MQNAERARIARELAAAREQRRPVAPLTSRYPELTLFDAYAIQLADVAERVAAGGVVAGHKVGLTSAAMQAQLGVDQPDYGHLFQDMFYEDRQAIPVDVFVQPKVEPEIAFVLGTALQGPGLTTADVASAVTAVVPALEIIDSRIADWKIGLLDTIADNASSAGVVLGATSRRLAGIDLRLAGCNLWRNGELVATGASGAVLGSPLKALTWVANTLGERGTALSAGHVVLPGSCTAALAVTGGTTVTATFAGLGSVTARFTGGSA